jgi:hypothetical protein
MRTMADEAADRERSRPTPFKRLAVAVTLAVAGLGTYAVSRSAWEDQAELPSSHQTQIGVNLFGLQTFNRQQVFTDLTAHSEWFSSTGAGWTLMPAAQLDRHGWVRYLAPGQTAPRPLILPTATSGPIFVRCRFVGEGRFSVGGVAAIEEQAANTLLVSLRPTGTADEAAWLELIETSPANPVRDLDCREPDRPRHERFHPDFLQLVQGFHLLRFLDWQRTNDNLALEWRERALPLSSSQVTPAGVSIEDMVDLANLVSADPWFLIPYQADDGYIREFAELVHSRLDPRRKVYVELGNEVWNDMFDAARQAEREGLALGLGGGDPRHAQSARYADKLCRAMRIWSAVFADQPARLIRVAASHNADPDRSRIILAHGRTADCVDALATAPYIWLDLPDRGAVDVDGIFARLPGKIDEALDAAQQNRAIAAQFGKRFIAYEGGQHLVTPDMTLAYAIQRDRRMGEVYRAYLQQWHQRIGTELTLYASHGAIGEYGAWGLREYSDQPVTQTPKLAAVRQFMAGLR